MVNGRPGVAPQTAKREEFTRLIAEGLSIAEAVRRVGIHYRTGRRWLRGRTVRMPFGLARHYDPVIIVKAPVSARFLSEDERITIADLRRRGPTIRDIGARLERAPSTISRELRRSRAPEGGYRPFRAHRMAQARRLRPGRGKIRQDPVLARFVQDRLDRRWSPAQISKALRCEYPDQPARQLSTEAIYQAIYRSGREIRRPQRGTLLAPGAVTAVGVWRLVIACDGWCPWSPSMSGPTSPTGPWPGTGRVISSSGPGTGRRSGRWWSARVGTRSSCTWPATAQPTPSRRRSLPPSRTCPSTCAGR